MKARNILAEVEVEISNVLKEQYGDGEVKFNFGLPEIDSFYKTGNLLMADNGNYTTISEKGTGMQRALALSLIQVYSGIAKNEIGSKPIMFFIDEPETFLHPKAQDKLIDSLNRLADKSQVFITTHSPYLLRKFNSDTQQINIFYKNDKGDNKISDKKQLNLFGTSSPTLGEINYVAFEIESVEFHNELYGFLQARAMEEDSGNYHEKNFDQWLVSRGLSKNKRYIRVNSNGTIQNQNKTLPTFIRNIIHHPENTNNEFNSKDLSDSIKELLSIM